MQNLFKFFLLFIIFTSAKNQNYLIKKKLNNVYKNYENKNNYSIKFQYLIHNSKNKFDKKNTNMYYYHNKKYNISIFEYNYIYDGKKHYEINHKNKEIKILTQKSHVPYILLEKLNFYKNNCIITSYTSNINKKVQNIDLYPIKSKQNIDKIKLKINLSKKKILELQEQYKNGIIITIKILNFNDTTKLNNNLFHFDQKKYQKYKIKN